MKKIIVMLFLMLCLAGCSKKESIDDLLETSEGDTIKSQEETSSISKKEMDEIKKQKETLNLQYYVSDSHFLKSNKNQKFMAEDTQMEISIENAFISKNEADGGEYFVKSDYLEEFMNDQSSYLFIKVKLKNISKSDKVFCVGSISASYRELDNSKLGSKYGYTDMITLPITTEVDFDKVENKDNSRYMINISSGEEIEMTLEYCTEYTKLENCYLNISYLTNKQKYDSKINANLPVENVNIKYIPLIG